MKTTLIILSLLAASHAGWAQRVAAPQPAARVSVNVSFDMQGFAPFSKLRTYVDNRGFSVALAYRYNKTGSLWQQLKGGMYFNRFHGASQYISSSLQFNPLHGARVNGGILLGAGYMRSGFKTGGWKQSSEQWTRTTNVHGFAFIPAAAQVSLRAYAGNRIHIWPTFAYQANALLGYTANNFVVPQSILSTGLTIKF